MSRRLLLSFCLAWTLSAHAGEPIKYNNEGIELAKEVFNYLVSAGHCQSEIECLKKEMVFSTNMDDGVKISVYEISNPAEVKEIANITFNYYMRQDAKLAVFLDIYKQKNRDLPSAFFLKTPYYSLKLPIVSRDAGA